VQDLLFDSGGRSLTARIDSLVIAGWTGRDREAVEHHIAELEAIGVARPSTIPSFYHVGASLLTTADRIDVIGAASSGEVEIVLLSLPEGLYVGVGSDHTDRHIETVSVTAAKQMCPKPLGRMLWAFDEVEAHWDELILRSWVTANGVRRPYQEGAAARTLPPRELMSRYRGETGGLSPGTVMFCGTLPVYGEVGGGDRFEIEIEDPRRHTKLQHAYVARRLEIAG
jgi:hypothetical protein